MSVGIDEEASQYLVECLRKIASIGLSSVIQTQSNVGN